MLSQTDEQISSRRNSNKRFRHKHSIAPYNKYHILIMELGRNAISMSFWWCCKSHRERKTGFLLNLLP